jgi:acyl-CoA synthetase (AMP-forming)/AMP-acid ligase II
MRGRPAPPPSHPTLVHALLAAGDHPGGVTFVDLREREVRLGWAEVVARARTASARYRAWGVVPGDRVAIVLRTEPAFLDAFFGAWLAGAVPVPLYPPVRLGRLAEYRAATARMLAVSGARLVVSGGGTLGLLGEVVEQSAPPLGCRNAAALLSGAGDASGAGPLQPPGALGLVQFSSGSTVDPKPVALTHAALQAQVDCLKSLVEPTRADVLVSWLPLYHDMGLLGGLLGAMSYPGPLVLIPPEHFLARPALWLRAVARHRGTISPAPSFAYAYCADRVADADLAGLDLRSWRLALDGAEPVSGGALRRFAARFAPHGFDPRSLIPVYGLSEAALAVTFAARGAPLEGRRIDAARLARDGEVVDGDREVVPVGTPVPGVEVEVRDDRGRPLGEDRLGRIWASGPALFQGYLGDPAGTARALVDGWLDTGDLGFWSGGQLHVHGRAKDLVIVRGSNHAPEEFEEALAGLAGLRPGGAVALGRPAGDGGEGLLLLAERARRGAADGDGPLQAEIRRRLLARTGISPDEIRLLAPGTLPRTSSGKLRRQEALRRWLAGGLTPPGSAGPWSLAVAALRSRLALGRARRARPA